MPPGLLWIGIVLVFVAGGLIFMFIRKHKTADPPHFR
jgi:hypothetical protein